MITNHSTSWISLCFPNSLMSECRMNYFTKPVTNCFMTEHVLVFLSQRQLGQILPDFVDLTSQKQRDQHVNLFYMFREHLRYEANCSPGPWVRTALWVPGGTSRALSLLRKLPTVRISFFQIATNSIELFSFLSPAIPWPPASLPT